MFSIIFTEGKIFVQRVIFMVQKYYACIDLKSFFASVECVERGLDPFKSKLVVADSSRGSGAICLAVSPAMKAAGVRNRCRLFEIPPNMEYITALPRMKLYMQYSAEIYGIYLDYISSDDIHVYSIDECFLDITPYMKLYKRDAKEIVKLLMQAVYDKTGICATGGIGTNLFLAKVALDITAKHCADCIGFLDEEAFCRELWHHRPITDIWNVGRGIAARLAKYGIFDMYGVAHTDPKQLYKEFGVNAEFLIDHSRGIEPCTIKEIHEYVTKSRSLSNSQILFEDYSYEDTLIVMTEMVELLVLEMIGSKLVCDSIFLRIGYSKDVIKSTGGSRKIGFGTNSFKVLSALFEDLYKKQTVKGVPIRKISVGAGGVVPERFAVYDLFTDINAVENEHRIQQAVVDIKKRFGKNAVLRCSSLQEKATARQRNKLIGGHNGE